MRSKGTETGETLEGDPPEDEGGVSSSVPSGGVSHWTQPAANQRVCPSTSDMLYVNLEETYPASPPFLERDPNMSSAARYSPLHHAPPPLTLPPLAPHYLGGVGSQSTLGGQPYLQQYAQHTMHTERLAPLLQVMGEESGGAPAAPYYPPLTSGADAYGVSSSSTSSAVYMPPGHHHNTHMMDTTTDLQLVLASNGEYHMIDGSGMKAEHVELLITGGQSGISYSLSSENGFIVARPTVTSCSGTKDQVDVITESSTMAVGVSLLDSLDEGSHFDEDQSIVMESETLDNTNLHLDIGQSDDLILPHDGADSISASHLQDVGCEEMVGFEDIAEYLSGGEPHPGGRSRRRQPSLMDDDNTITCIPDKSVPCRARASLPAAHLCLGRLRGVFARRRIPARACFGPLEGVRRRLSAAQPRPPRQLHFLLHTSAGDYTVDVSDEKTSNWMRYVRFEPGPNQNVCLQQSGSELYFISCQPIAPRQELILGYGFTYARQWELPSPPPHAIDSEESTLAWPCYECPMRFASSPELQAHLNMHDDDDKKTVTIRRPKKKAAKTMTSSDYRCDVCSRTFPRCFSLKRHMLTHVSPHSSVDEASSKISLSDIGSSVTSAADLSATFDTGSSMKMDLNTLDDFNTAVYPQHHLRRTKSQGQEREQLVPDSQIQIDHDSTTDSSSDQLNSEESYGQKENTSIEANTNVYQYNICQKMCSSIEPYDQHKNVIKTEDLKAEPCPDCPSPEVTVEIQENSIAAKKSSKSGAMDDTAAVSDSTTTEQLKVPSLGIYCLICPRNFSHTWMLKEHTQSQHRRADGQYDCPMCDKRLPDYARIKKHIRGFHAVRRFSCQLCATNFSSSDKLRMHMLKHSEHREFLCPDCGKQFKRKDKLKDHIKKIHNLAKKDVEVAVKVPKAVAASPPADPTAYLTFTFKCHPCKLGFKRRGMLVNHLARRHPDVARSSVPELQLPILRAARDYYCQHCHKVYKSSSKRKAHILKNHPGESVPPSSRGVSLPEGGSWAAGYSACVGAVPSAPHHCPHQPCHKQYASKAKLLQHIRLNHPQQNGTADSKENAIIANLEKEIQEEAMKAKELVSSTIQIHNSGKLQELNSENKMSRSVKGNIFSQNGESEKMKSPVFVFKPRPLSSPPPLTPVSSYKAKPPLVNNNTPSLTPFARLTTLNGNTKKTSEMNYPTKPLTELKLSSLLSGSPKQAVCNTTWKNNNSDANHFRVIQPCDGMQLLEHGLSGVAESQQKDKGNGKVMEEEIPKLHISGHIMSVEGNKLPPMSVLAGTSGKGGAMTRYTDR